MAGGGLALYYSAVVCTRSYWKSVLVISIGKSSLLSDKRLKSALTVLSSSY